MWGCYRGEGQQDHSQDTCKVLGMVQIQVLSTSPQPVLLTHLRNDSCSRVDGAGRGGGSRDSQPPQGWCRVRMLVLAKVEGQ